MSARRRRILALAGFLLAFGVGAAVYLFGGLSSLEASTVQTRFTLRDRPRPKNIVIVAIDDNSLRQLGQYPFPRSLDARAIDAIHAARPREIVYDVQFTTPTTPSQDGALYDALGRAGGAVLATTFVRLNGTHNVFGGQAHLVPIHSVAGYSGFPTTTGGVIERMPYDKNGLRSFALLAAERASGRHIGPAAFGSDGAMIDYQGPPSTFPMVSFADLVSGTVPASFLHGKIVLIGATAAVLQDRHQTPAGSTLMSGPEIQANAVWTALNGFPLRAASDFVSLLVIALLAAAAPVFRLRARTLAVAAGAVGVAVLYAVVAQLVFDAGVVLPVVSPMLSLAVGTGATIISSELAEAAERRKLTRQLTEAHLELIHRLSQAAESRDQHTGEHLERIGRLTRILGRAAGMSEHEAEMLQHASLMHDIGKIGIPDAVLLKSGPLEPGEREIMNTHTDIGGDILSGSDSTLVQMAEAVARTHHEHWDGSGYPAGLKGEEIPLAGRICSVCDVFDALVTARVYKPAWSVEDAVAELRRLSGTAFDPRLVELFVSLIPTLDADLLAPSFLPDSEAVDATGGNGSAVPAVVQDRIVVPDAEVRDQRDGEHEAAEERQGQGDRSAG
jgi:CHASE2 domain-containing sensor protein